MRKASFVSQAAGQMGTCPLCSHRAPWPRIKLSNCLLCASLLSLGFLIENFLLCRFSRDFINNASYVDEHNKITDYNFSCFFKNVYVSLLMDYL